MEGAYAVFLEELGSRTLRRVACEEGIGLVGELLELGEVLGLDAVLERVEVWRLPYDGQRGKREGEGSDFDRLELAEVGAAFGQELDARFVAMASTELVEQLGEFYVAIVSDVNECGGRFTRIRLTKDLCAEGISFTQKTSVGTAYLRKLHNRQVTLGPARHQLPAPAPLRTGLTSSPSQTRTSSPSSPIHTPPSSSHSP